MKTNIYTLILVSLMSIGLATAQDRTTVTANNTDISDNLDLRAVASIFGESKDLDDFENRLNNPKYQISNLDLNNDNQVDYLRVIETVQENAHLIIIQSVIGRDMFQDIATVEVMKDRNNKVQVQVVGDVYMYGNNYIYEPVYTYTPVIYGNFWAPRYRPYYSSWYWGYYPSYYVAWHPFSIFTYRSNVNIWINYNNHYNYVDYRNCGVVYNNYYRGNRGNAYETQHPNRSFNNRNQGYTNRRDLDQTRNLATGGSRNNVSRSNDTSTSRNNAANDNRISTNNETTRYGGTRTGITRTGATLGNNENSGIVRNNSASTNTKVNPTTRSYSQNNPVRDVATTRSDAGINSATTRSNNSSNSSRSNDTRSTNSGSTIRSQSQNNNIRSTDPTRSNNIQSSSPSRNSGTSSSSRGNSSSDNSRGSRSGR